MTLKSYPSWVEVNAMTPEDRREYTERYIKDCAFAVNETFAKAVLLRDKEAKEKGWCR